MAISDSPVGPVTGARRMAPPLTSSRCTISLSTDTASSVTCSMRASLPRLWQSDALVVITTLTGLRGPSTQELPPQVDGCASPIPGGTAGRPPSLPRGVVERIRLEYARGRGLAEIARALDDDGVPTAHGGQR